MQTGKSNDPGLATRLESLTLPAASSFKKEAAWERLRNRLGERKKHRRKALLIALLPVPIAASLIYFLVMTGHTRKEEGKRHQVNLPQASVSTIPEVKTITIDNIAKKQTPHHIARKSEAAGLTQENHPETVAIDPVAVAIVPDTIAPSTVAIDPVVKKKLKVIHNNELGSPVVVQENEKNETTASSKRGFLQGLRKSTYAGYEEISDDTIRKHKPKLSLLPFSSLISQKE